MKKHCVALVLTAALGCGTPNNTTHPPVPTPTGGTPGSGGSGGSISAGSGGSGGSGGSSAGTGGSAPSADAAPPPAGPDAGAPPTSSVDAGAAPLLPLLAQFTAADVPMRGPMESPPTPRSWMAPAMAPMHPGNGLGQHPFLYAGEGFNTIFLVNEGKVIWSYATAPGGEIDDVWMLSNGHIMYAHLNFLEELTPKKEVVWHYALPGGSESHSLQPIGLDKVLFMANGTPAKLIVMNKADNAIIVTHDLPDAGATVHPQFRRIRQTAAGTYLAPYLEARKIVEYDKDFKVIWNYPVPDMGTPWTALRLRNGNTLIQDEHNKSAREVNPMGTIVWEFKQTDLPPGLTQSSPQTSERLENGNTVIFAPGKNVGNIQVVEVDKDKKVVWILQDWANLGPATTAQFLDQPGIPEVPGDLIH